MPDIRKADRIAHLRRQVAALGGCADHAANGQPKIAAVDLGKAEAGLSLPELACNALHELRAAAYRDMGASIGFAAAVAVCCARTFAHAPILWCESARGPFDVGQFYGPGLAAFGLDPARLIIASPSSTLDLLWTMEEALRLGAFAGVFGEIDGRASALTLTATRRLQLAAEAGGRPAFLLTGHAGHSASAATTRWEVSAAPSDPDADIATLIGSSRWRLRLMKHKSAWTSADQNMFDRDWYVAWDAHLQKLYAAPDQHKSTPAEMVPQSLAH